MAISIQEAAETPVYKAQSWGPKQVGDGIAGRVISLEYTQTKNGIRQLMKVDATEVVQDGHKDIPGVYQVWERAQLNQIWADKQVRPGDEIALVYRGEEKTGRGVATKTFSAEVRRTKDSVQYVKPKKPEQDAFKNDIPF